MRLSKHIIPGLLVIIPSSLGDNVDHDMLPQSVCIGLCCYSVQSAQSGCEHVHGCKMLLLLLWQSEGHGVMAGCPGGKRMMVCLTLSANWSCMPQRGAASCNSANPHMYIYCPVRMWRTRFEQIAMRTVVPVQCPRGNNCFRSALANIRDRLTQRTVPCLATIG